MVEVNSLGKFQRSLGIRPSVQGKDIQLTIDLNLQLVAEEVLKDKKSWSHNSNGSKRWCNKSNGK